MKTRSERLATFVQRFESAALCSSFQEARALLEALLNAVEDEHSGVPYDSSTFGNDGRLYPPLDDNARVLGGSSSVIRFRNKGHYTSIADNGAVRIQTLKGEIILDKPGADGRLVPYDVEP